MKNNKLVAFVSLLVLCVSVISAGTLSKPSNRSLPSQVIDNYQNFDYVDTTILSGETIYVKAVFIANQSASTSIDTVTLTVPTYISDSDIPSNYLKVDGSGNAQFKDTVTQEILNYIKDTGLVNLFNKHDTLTVLSDSVNAFLIDTNIYITNFDTDIKLIDTTVQIIYIDTNLTLLLTELKLLNSKHDTLTETNDTINVIISDTKVNIDFIDTNISLILTETKKILNKHDTLTTNDTVNIKNFSIDTYIDTNLTLLLNTLKTIQDKHDTLTINDTVNAKLSDTNINITNFDTTYFDTLILIETSLKRLNNIDTFIVTDTSYNSFLGIDVVDTIVIYRYDSIETYYYLRDSYGNILEKIKR